MNPMTTPQPTIDVLLPAANNLRTQQGILDPDAFEPQIRPRSKANRHLSRMERQVRRIYRDVSVQVWPNASAHGHGQDDTFDAISLALAT
ncbi:MAG: hypothetical protein V4754_19090 [Pseudomonadota bacterium]